ncbi:MAG: hypothetical protein FWG33_00915, partial [Oscillospiraceae bacterium]|nr:hypothetical protein [Oscillospiraceae bacterium]
KLSQVMFDFLPRGDILQIDQQLRRGLEIISENPEMGGTFYAFGNVAWSGYDLLMIVYCGDVEFPANYVEALHQADFFENITYGGFVTIQGSEIEDVLDGTVPAGAVVAFPLALRLKGGHIFESDGSKFGAAE